ncbi:hypothetical protein LINGRAHAP2_LOCUS23499 [Linum grandiflorum]
MGHSGPLRGMQQPGKLSTTTEVLLLKLLQ